MPSETLSRTHLTAMQISLSRNRTGLTQTDFGHLLGQSKGTIIRWERDGALVSPLVALLVDRIELANGRAVLPSRWGWWRLQGRDDLEQGLTALFSTTAAETE
ncbi:hypothetical protein HN937_30305 [Candidatus Poribacteria bacterium]|nr:hypothetical protein [Candidatus Poribacteria bacterium]